MLLTKDKFLSKIMDGVNLYLRTLQELLRSLFGNLALSYSAKWHRIERYSIGTISLA